MRKKLLLALGAFMMCLYVNAQSELPEISTLGHDIWYYVQFEETGFVVEQHGIETTTYPDLNNDGIPLTRIGKALTTEIPVSGKGEQLWKVDRDATGQFYIFYNYADKELKMVYKSFNNDFGSGYYGSYALYDIEYNTRPDGTTYQASTYNNFTIIKTTDGQHLSLNARNNDSDYFPFPVSFGEFPSLLGPPYSDQAGARIFRNRNIDDGTIRGTGNEDYGINPHCWLKFIPAEELFPDCGVNYEQADLVEIDKAGMTAIPEEASVVIDGDTETFFTGETLIIDLGENAEAYELAYIKLIGTAEAYGLRIVNLYLGNNPTSSFWNKLGTTQLGGESYFYLPIENDIQGRYLKIESSEAGLSEIYVYRRNSYAGTPYNAPHNLSCVIEAEDFDNGGEGVAYHDEPGLQNGAASNPYRAENGDVEIEAGPVGGYHIGWTNPGEWLKYTVYSPSDSYFDFTFSCANQNNSTFTVLINDVEIPELKDIAMNATGSYDTYQDITVEKVKLYTGINVLTLQVNSGNFDKISIIRTPYKGTPYLETGAFVVPSEGEVKIEAEYFDKGGEGVAFHDRDNVRSGNCLFRNDDEDKAVDIVNGANEGEYYVGESNIEEWLNYSISVQEAGNYDFIIAHKNSGNQTSNYILSDDISLRVYDLPGTPNSGNDWQESILYNLSLTAGEHILTLHVWADFDYFIIRKSTRTPYTAYTDGQIQTIKSEGESIIHLAGFDNGGEGVAYHDTNSDGSANADRTDVGVGIANYVYGEVPYYIKNIEDGEWLIYTINVEKSGYYYINRIAVGGREGVGKFTILLDETSKLLSNYTPTSDAQGLGNLYEDFPTEVVPQLLLKGLHILRIVADEGGFELGFLEFLKDRDYNGGTAIHSLEDFDGKIYSEGNALHIDGASGAALTVYNLVGQKVAALGSIKDAQTVNLPAKGVYIVSLKKDGKTYNVKVLVK
jgi:hypothetical protein